MGDYTITATSYDTNLDFSFYDVPDPVDISTGAWIVPSSEPGMVTVTYYPPYYYPPYEKEPEEGPGLFLKFNLTYECFSYLEEWYPIITSACMDWYPPEVPLEIHDLTFRISRHVFDAPPG